MGGPCPAIFNPRQTTHAHHYYPNYLISREQPYALHLMEDGVVMPVDLVPPVNVAGDEKSVQSRPDQIDLMSRRVGAEHVRAVHVVAVALATRRVRLGHEQTVEVLFQRHHGTQSVVHRKVGVAPSVHVVLREEVGDSPLEQLDRMAFLEVQLALGVAQDAASDVRLVVRFVRLSVDRNGVPARLGTLDVHVG